MLLRMFAAGQKEEVLFEKEIPIADAAGKEFAWEAEAIGDVMKEPFDAASGVQEITVK
jgi:hypothetical protein